MDKLILDVDSAKLEKLERKDRKALTIVETRLQHQFKELPHLKVVIRELNCSMRKCDFIDKRQQILVEVIDYTAQDYRRKR